MSIPTTILKYWAIMNSNYIVEIKELLLNFHYVLINSADSICRIWAFNTENTLLKTELLPFPGCDESSE